jgi:Family of unknown function (DUF6129)
MINPEQLQTLAARISTQPLNETLISQVRAEFQGIHFTYCMDDDISNHEPVLSSTNFNLYLIDGREHCLCLTNNFENATGIVIAEIIAD